MTSEFHDFQHHMRTLHGWIYDGFFVPYLSPANASLAFGVFFVFVIFLMIWPIPLEEDVPARVRREKFGGEDKSSFLTPFVTLAPARTM